MRLYTDRDEERSLRETLLLTADEYRNLRESIGIPITNFNGLMESIEDATIYLYVAENEREKNARKIKIDKKQIDLQTDYLNGLDYLEKKNLLYHELSDLSSPLLEYYQKDLHVLISKYTDMLYDVQNDDVSSFDVYMGLTAIEGVTAEWLSERSAEELSGKQKERKKERVSILNNNIEYSSDFSLDSLYAPLQGYVEDFAKSSGYTDFRDFVKDMYTGKIDFNTFVTENNIEYLGNLGRFAKGLYKEKNFWKNSSVSEKDVSKSLQVLNKNRISEKEESMQEIDLAERTDGNNHSQRNVKVMPSDIVEVDMDRKISYSLIGSIKSFFSRLLDRFKGEGEK